MKKKFPLISVVVCSLNGADVIADALKAIKAQKWGGKLEIIVVDDGSTDDTYKIAKSFKGIKVIKNAHNLGLSASRNIAIKIARGEIIAFTDDDCRPRPTWIRELYNGYYSEKIVGVGGSLISKDMSSLTQRYLHVNNPHVAPTDVKQITSNKPINKLKSYLKKLIGITANTNNGKRHVNSLLGGNMSFRKISLEKAGLFDENFTFGSEEIELAHRIINKDPEGLYFNPKAIVNHKYDNSLTSNFLRSKSYGIGAARLSRKQSNITPILYPIPMLIILSVLLAIFNAWWLLVSFVLILVIYSSGIRTAIKKRKLEPLLYGYIQFIDEIYYNIGFIKGWIKFRNTFKRKSSTKQPINILEDKKLKFPFKNKNFKIPATTIVNNDISISKKNNRFWVEGLTLFSLLGLVLIMSEFKDVTALHIPSAMIIIFTSGYLLLRWLRIEREQRLPTILLISLMAAAGISWIIFFGLLADLILPTLGFKHPLTNNWLPLIFVVTTSLFIPWSIRYKKAPKRVTTFKFNWETYTLFLLLILMLFLSFIGARLLNNRLSNISAILAFTIGALTIVFTVIKQHRLPKYAFPIALFVISLASLWSYSLRSNYVFGWDIQQEFRIFQQTLTSGHWSFGSKHTSYGAMLSLTILPVTIVKLSGISGLTVFKFLVPILFSFMPIILYFIFRLFTKKWISFLAALIIIAQFHYMQTLTQEVRQQIAFLFFASILYLLLQNKISRNAKNSLLLIFVLSLVVSHYATTYMTIAFLGGAYILSKITYIIYIRHKKIEKISQRQYIPGWLILVLVLFTVFWYGPVAHSSGYFNEFTSKHTYSNIIPKIQKVVLDEFNKHTYDPKTTKEYLESIGNVYHKGSNNYLTYYSHATNASIHPKTQPVIKAKSIWIKNIADALTTIFSYGWWMLLASAGIFALLVNTYRNFDYRKLELIILGSIGIMAFIAMHLTPEFNTIYSPSRLDEQLLIIDILPAVLMLIWLMRKITIKSIRSMLTGLIVITYLIASGLINQYVGGKPPANLNNFGIDYDSLYIHQSELASVKWLGGQYTSKDIVYVDSYSALRLLSYKDTDHGQKYDVTPDTISIKSFVYADYENVRYGIATKEINNVVTFNYQFPASFLQQNKNLVYNNGYSEVYK